MSCCKLTIGIARMLDLGVQHRRHGMHGTHGLPVRKFRACDLAQIFRTSSCSLQMSECKSVASTTISAPREVLARRRSCRTCMQLFHSLGITIWEVSAVQYSLKAV